MSIELKGVYKQFGSGENPVLTDINFSIETGSFVSLTGRSGSGKSTLLYIMSSLDKPTSGTVRIHGQEIEKLSTKDLHALRNQKIGFVFQFHYLLPELTALENVLMPTRKIGLKKEPKALELLERFLLKDKIHRLPRALSGGEQQRVSIARALIMDPAYLFADEPTGSLDTANGTLVMDILKQVNQEQKTTLVLVTHEPEFAQMAKRTLHLSDGKLVADQRSQG